MVSSTYRIKACLIEPWELLSCAWRSPDVVCPVRRGQRALVLDARHVKGPRPAATQSF